MPRHLAVDWGDSVDWYDSVAWGDSVAPVGRHGVVLKVIVVRSCRWSSMLWKERGRVWVLEREESEEEKKLES